MYFFRRKGNALVSQPYGFGEMNRVIKPFVFRFRNNLRSASFQLNVDFPAFNSLTFRVYIYLYN